MSDLNKKGIAEFLLKHSEREPVSFHMPGHKGSKLYRGLGYGKFLEHMMDCDITEIEGADNLFQQEGIISVTMDRYKRLYRVKKSYLLINGTSCGLISAIMALVKPGGKLIMARNCHKSVFNALTLGNIKPIYAYPEMIEEFGISGEISVGEIQRLLVENPDAAAIILPSPNYYGICSDIEQIAEIVHKAGKLLIVDQAHGAHLKFFEEYGGLPKSAETCGADVVVNSIHKTLASFTQSAVMNVVSDKVDLDELEDKLQAIESTSPSYLLMASLDINADVLENSGSEQIGKWKTNLDYFYSKAKQISGLRLINTGCNMDTTKINLDMSACGVSGHELEARLMGQGIFVELVTGNIVMCMSGIGNVQEDFEKLLAALTQIATERGQEGVTSGFKEIRNREQPNAVYDYATLARRIPKHDCTYEIPQKKERIPIDEGAGRICAVSIIPYPPGIPLICPGEIVSREAIDYMKALRAGGEKVMGIDEQNRISVGKSVN